MQPNEKDVFSQSEERNIAYRIMFLFSASSREPRNHLTKDGNLEQPWNGNDREENYGNDCEMTERNKCLYYYQFLKTFLRQESQTYSSSISQVLFGFTKQNNPRLYKEQCFLSLPPWQPTFAVNVGLSAMAASQFPARELMAATKHSFKMSVCSSNWFEDLFLWKLVTIQGLWKLRIHLKRQP